MNAPHTLGSTTYKLEVFDEWIEQYEPPDDDPIEFEGYDEQSAFPALKPDANVLPSCAGRTRRQRGWYHIIRWPGRFFVAERQPTGEQPLAIGGDLPVELFLAIAKHINPSEYHWAVTELREQSRRQFGTCASV